MVRVLNYQNSNDWRNVFKRAGEAIEFEWEQSVKRNQELLRLKKIEEARRNHLFELAQAFDQTKSIRNLVLAFK